MRLTKTHREAFVARVMADLPRIDYQEQIQKIMLDHALAKLPAKVRALYDNTELRPWVSQTYWSWWEHVREESLRTQLHVSVYVPANESYSALPEEAKPLFTAWKDQLRRHHELQTSLIATVAGCSTLRSLRETLPQFAKYMPEVEEANRNPLAITGVVDAFKAAGWPKDAVAA